MKSNVIFFSSISSLVFVFIVIAGFVVKEDRNPPNIIILLADDAGYADFGFMGSRDIKTPNLDQLANNGILFTQHYVSASVCSPSRAGLLTGRYQQSFGHECNLEPLQGLAFDTAQVTIAEALKERGYKTSIFGKWHLGDFPHHHPLNNGFDKFWGFIAGGRSYFPNENHDRDGSFTAILDNKTTTTFEGYLTDVIGEQATGYIEQLDDDPFFMYVSFNAPHTPMHAKQDVIEKFRGNTERHVYAAMMWSMDEAIGKIINKLKEKGIYDNTLIFFLSDNGGAGNNQSSVAPLKGWKGNQYEGGIRTPLVLSWPSGLKGKKTYTGVVSALDIFATLVDVANVEETNQNRLDGKSLMPFLLSNDYSVDVHTHLFWRKGDMASARIGDYKLIRLHPDINVLYNIKNDLAEVCDLSGSDPLTLKKLEMELNRWERDISQPIWLEPADWNIVTRMIYEDLMSNRPIRVKAPSDLPQKERDESARFGQ